MFGLTAYPQNQYEIQVHITSDTGTYEHRIPFGGEKTEEKNRNIRNETSRSIRDIFQKEIENYILLAYSSGDTGWTTTDKRILRIPSVADSLASASNITGWKTQNKEILWIPNVAFWLATHSKENGWRTTDLDILQIVVEFATPKRDRIYKILNENGCIPKELYNVCRMMDGGTE